MEWVFVAEQSVAGIHAMWCGSRR